MALRILFVEDDAGTREALVAALTVSGFELAGVFGNGEEAIAAGPRIRPDVALVDLGLPGVSGFEVTRALRHALPELPVLVHTVFESPPEIFAAIEAGASGYLLKGTPLDQVCAAIRQVKEGLSPISPAVARHLLNQFRQPEKASRSPLSTREGEVLELLVRGHTYADAGRALGLQLATVQTHVRSIYRKLEVASKAEATLVALRDRLVRP